MTNFMVVNESNLYAELENDNRREVYRWHRERQPDGTYRSVILINDAGSGLLVSRRDYPSSAYVERDRDWAKLERLTIFA